MERKNEFMEVRTNCEKQSPTTDMATTYALFNASSSQARNTEHSSPSPRKAIDETDGCLTSQDTNQSLISHTGNIEVTRNNNAVKGNADRATVKDLSGTYALFYTDSAIRELETEKKNLAKQLQSEYARIDEKNPDVPYAIFYTDSPDKDPNKQKHVAEPEETVDEVVEEISEIHKKRQLWKMLCTNEDESNERTTHAKANSTVQLKHETHENKRVAKTPTAPNLDDYQTQPSVQERDAFLQMLFRKDSFMAVEDEVTTVGMCNNADYRLSAGYDVDPSIQFTGSDDGIITRERIPRDINDQRYPTTKHSTAYAEFLRKDEKSQISKPKSCPAYDRKPDIWEPRSHDALDQTTSILSTNKNGDVLHDKQKSKVVNSGTKAAVEVKTIDDIENAFIKPERLVIGLSNMRPGASIAVNPRIRRLPVPGKLENNNNLASKNSTRRSLALRNRQLDKPNVSKYVLSLHSGIPNGIHFNLPGQTDEEADWGVHNSTEAWKQVPRNRYVDMTPTADPAAVQDISLIHAGRDITDSKRSAMNSEKVVNGKESNASTEHSAVSKVIQKKPDNFQWLMSGQSDGNISQRHQHKRH